MIGKVKMMTTAAATMITRRRNGKRTTNTTTRMVKENKNNSLQSNECHLIKKVALAIIFILLSRSGKKYRRVKTNTFVFIIYPPQTTSHPPNCSSGKPVKSLFR